MNTKRWMAFLPLLLGVLLAAGCYYMPSGAQGSVQVSMALTKGLPANVSSIALIVSGPGMKTMANEYPVGTTSVSVEVPAGLARTFTLLPSTPSVTFKGEATVDLVAGEKKEITLTPELFDSQIIVPDFLNNRLVQIADMLGTGWTVKMGSVSAISPYDVDFDSQGSIFVANNSGSSPLLKLDDVPTGTLQTVSIATAFTFLYALAIDRPANLIYFTNGSLLYKKDLGNAADLGSPLSITPPGSIMGLAVDQNGMLYIAAYSGSAVGGSLIKYDPVAGMQITSYASGSDWDPWDVSVQGGYLYTTHMPISGVYKIARSDLNLKPMGEFSAIASVPLYGPRRFVAILSKRITFIDDAPFPANADRLVSMNNTDGAGLQTYGSSGSGQDQFNFYSMC